MKTPAAIILAAVLLLSAGCGAPLVEAPPPDLSQIEEVLGYSLAPAALPESFEFKSCEILGYTESIVSSTLIPYACLYYNGCRDYPTGSIMVQYPRQFPPTVSDDYLLESLGIEWHRPDDAVKEVSIDGHTAHIVRGGWSGESMHCLTSLDTEALAEYTPVWNYDLYLSLYFDYELSSDETIGVSLTALLYPEDWITSGEMVGVAESLQRIN